MHMALPTISIRTKHMRSMNSSNFTNVMIPYARVGSLILITIRKVTAALSAGRHFNQMRGAAPCAEGPFCPQIGH